MFKIITIPFDRSRKCFLEEDLNSFCLNKLVKKYRAEFFQIAGEAYWTVFFEYEHVIQDNDTKQRSFSKQEELLFKRLREWRKSKAQDMGVPVYIIATNRQLEDIISNTPKTIEGIKSIKGFGKKKVENFGTEIVNIIKSFFEVKNECRISCLCKMV